MRKIVLFFMLAILPLAATAGRIYEIGVLKYSISESLNSYIAEVKGLVNNDYEGELNIPATIQIEDISIEVKSISNKAFYGCSGLTSVIIPNTIITIGNSSFYSCSNLQTVSIPNSSLSVIGKAAFQKCTSLTTITIPNSVTTIGDDAFRECSSLTTASIGNSVTSIGDNTFYDCTSLTSIYIGNSVRTIGKNSFCNCSSLERVICPNSLTSIGDGAFINCEKLTFVAIGNSVTSIGNYAFYNCDKLASINIPNSVTTIGYEAFVNCKSLSSIGIPNSVTILGLSAFAGCSGLTSVVIPNSITEISQDLFNYCTGLTSVTIPNSVTVIESYAFTNCSSLTTVTIPSSVTTIRSNAFGGTSNLTSVYCYAVDPPGSSGSEVFSNASKCTLYVPAGSKAAYEVSMAWSKFKEIIEMGTSNEPTIENYTITSEVIPTNGGTVYGTGIYPKGTIITLAAIPNSDYEFLWWDDGERASIRSVTVTGNKKYTAQFQQKAPTSYYITTEVTPPGSGTVTGGGTFNVGTVITLTATPNTGYEFVKWTDGVTSSTRTVTVTGNKTYTAQFQKKSYYIATVVTPPGSGTVTGGNSTFDWGTVITLTATPNTGYEFVKWNDGVTSSTRTVTVTGNKTYTAQFQKKTVYYTITTYVTPPGSGEVIGGGEYPEGSSVTLKVVTNGDYKFVMWDDGVTSHTRTIIVTGNMTYTAIFSPITLTYYEITADVTPKGSGKVKGTGSYPEDSEVELKAVPYAGFEFVKWTDGVTANPRTFIVTEDKHFTARFREIEDTSHQPGDINHDGVLNQLDLDALLEAYLSNAPATRTTDLDSDGELTIADITKLISIIY